MLSYFTDGLCADGNGFMMGHEIAQILARFRPRESHPLNKVVECLRQVHLLAINREKAIIAERIGIIRIGFIVWHKKARND
mgnify:CR=1 FL=1